MSASDLLWLHHELVQSFPLLSVSSNGLSTLAGCGEEEEKYEWQQDTKFSDYLLIYNSEMKQHPQQVFFHSLAFCLHFPDPLVPALLSVLSFYWHPFTEVPFSVISPINILALLASCYWGPLEPVQLVISLPLPKDLTLKCSRPTMPISVPCWLDLHLRFSSCLQEELLLHSHKGHMFLQNFHKMPCGRLIRIKNLKMILRHSLAGWAWLPWTPRWLARIPSFSLVLF